MTDYKEALSHIEDTILTQAKQLIQEREQVSRQAQRIQELRDSYDQLCEQSIENEEKADEHIMELEGLIKIAFDTNHATAESKAAHWEEFKADHNINQIPVKVNQ